MASRAAVALQVAGRGGVPATGVSAVVLNVTVTSSTSGGYVTAYASGTTRPLASNLNFVKGQTVPNLVLAPVGADGKVMLYNSSLSTHLVADVSGYVLGGSPEAAGSLGMVTPARLLDTRRGVGAPAGPVASRAAVALQVAGRGGVPATGVSAVVLNVTVTSSTSGGYVTAYASGTTRPLASNLNFVKGQTVPNLVLAPVGADGKVMLYNSSLSTHLVADVSGYVLGGSPEAAGSLGMVTPARLLDTRRGVGAPAGPVASRAAVALQVAGRGGVPATGVSAVVLNVTVTSSTSGGYVTAYASGTTRPLASNLNFVKGQTVPNLVLAPVGADGKVMLYNSSLSTHLVADVSGYVRTSATPLAVSTSELTPGIAGGNFLSQLEATGGTAPYVWTVSGLPSGLSSTSEGTVSGVATAPFDGSVFTTVTDGKGVVASATIGLRINQGLPTACGGPDGCVDTHAQPRTLAVPATRIGAITVDTSGAPAGVILTGSAPTVNDVLVLAPTSDFPTGVVVVVTGVTDRGDGTWDVAVTPGQFADAFDQGTLRVQGTPLTGADVAPASPAPLRRSALSKRLATDKKSNKTSAKAIPELSTRAAAASAGGLSCDDPTVSSDLHGLSVEPNLQPALAAIWKHPIFGGGGIYVGTGGLDLFQVDMDGSITVNMGAHISGATTCHLTLPRLTRAFPAGDTGAILLDVQPGLTLTTSGNVDIRATITLTCGYEYRWSEGTESRVSYCRATSSPLQVATSTGADVTTKGTLDTTVSWNGVAGVTGNLTASVHAGYHPTSQPQGVVDGSVNGNIGACLACFWKSSPARVTVLSKTFFNKVIATWGNVPTVPNAGPPTITTATVPTATVGQPYVQRLRTADNRNGQWALDAGSLPAGLTLEGDTIGGKATTVQSGVHFTVGFTDTSGRHAARNYVLQVVAGSAAGGAIQDLSFCGSNVIAANDDGGSDAVPLPFPMHLGSQTYDTTYVGNNGYVTFGSSMSTYTPFPMLESSQAVIAPYFSDIDTRSDSSPLVTYGQSADGTQFCVNWVGVGYFDEHIDKTVSLQMVISTRPDTGAGNFDVTFNYGPIQWETGDFSGGVGGIGGVPARAGWTDGNGNGAELTGSGQSGAFLDGGQQALISGSQNSGVAGRYMWDFRGGAA